MTDARIEALTELPADTAEAVLGLIEAATAADGQPAVSESGRLHVRGGAREGVRHLLLWTPGEAGAEGADGAGADLTGYAQIDGSDPVEAPSAELVVHPARRSRGHGRTLAAALLDTTGKRVRVWAHGGHPAARHLAVQLGLKLFRELRQMRRPLTPDAADLPEPRLPDGITVRTFVPGRDDAAWLAVNAAAFAHHPEQGSLTQRDLSDRLAEPWFDPAGFFLAFRGDDLVGFHWTKVHPEGLGEVYVVGVLPAEQGSGLGRALTALGLRHLARDRRLPAALLYVDADNPAALSVYERLGFTTHEVDLMYRTET
ncbi:mycothiol synthase [Streptomyces sp. NPDC008139]|uniref:mycothiol synthase n=1 Tax=Streptomyces sp. NPDC008139 TaxID=3364814 RepID=UPI0036F07EDE